MIKMKIQNKKKPFFFQILNQQLYISGYCSYRGWYSRVCSWGWGGKGF